MRQNVFGMVETPGSALTLNLREHFLPKKVHRMNKLCRIFGIFVIIALIFKLTPIVITLFMEQGRLRGSLVGF